MPYLKNQDGLTLLETMIAMVILAIALLGLGQLQVVAIQGNNSSYTMVTATSVAAAGLEDLVQSYWRDAASVSCDAPETIMQSNVDYTRTCAISGLEIGQRTATVTVTWKGHTGSDRKVEVKTLL